MDFFDLVSFTKDENRQTAKDNMISLVQNNAHFEGIQIGLIETGTILNGQILDKFSQYDINTIVQIKRGWELITKSDSPLDLDFEKAINKVVAQYDSLAPGELRTGQGGVDIGSDEDFIPESVDEIDEENYLEQLLSSQKSSTEIALRLMYHNMRGQLFWDGNKRTATLAANKVMIDNGVGLINVPLDLWPTWNNLISDYYRTEKMDEILEWTYENGIQGVKL